MFVLCRLNLAYYRPSLVVFLWRSYSGTYPHAQSVCCHVPAQSQISHFPLVTVKIKKAFSQIWILFEQSRMEKSIIISLYLLHTFSLLPLLMLMGVFHTYTFKASVLTGEKKNEKSDRLISLLFTK